MTRITVTVPVQLEVRGEAYSGTLWRFSIGGVLLKHETTSDITGQQYMCCPGMPLHVHALGRFLGACAAHCGIG